MPTNRITDIEFDEELIELIHEMERAEQLVPMLMTLTDVWMEVSDELHDEVVARIEQRRSARV